MANEAAGQFGLRPVANYLKSQMDSGRILLGLPITGRILQWKIPNGLNGHGDYKQSRKLELSTEKTLTIVKGTRRYNDSRLK